MYTTKKKTIIQAKQLLVLFKEERADKYLRVKDVMYSVFEAYKINA